MAVVDREAIPMVIFFFRKTDNYPSRFNCPSLHCRHFHTFTYVIQTFANQLSPGAGKIFLFFRLSDLYHSSLFYILITLLSLNLIICSINRFPALWKQYKAPHFPEPAGIFDNLPQSRIITVDKEISKIKPIVESCLKKNYGHISEIVERKRTLFLCSTGSFLSFRCLHRSSEHFNNDCRSDYRLHLWP